MNPQAEIFKSENVRTRTQLLSSLKLSSSARQCKQFKIAADQRLKSEAQSNVCSGSLPIPFFLPKAQQLSKAVQMIQLATDQRLKSQAQSNVCSGSLPISFFLPKAQQLSPVMQTVPKSHRSVLKISSPVQRVLLKPLQSHSSFPKPSS